MGCFYAAGKVLGGSNSINVMVYLRGTDRDYDRWEEMGNPTWNWENALHYFKKSKGNKNAALVAANPRYHNANGKLLVGEYGEVDPFGEVFIEGVVQSGYDRLTDFNAGRWLGVGNIHRAPYTVDGVKRQRRPF